MKNGGCCSYHVCLYAKKIWHLLIMVYIIFLWRCWNCDVVKICHNTHSALKSTEVDIFGTFISKGLVGLSVWDDQLVMIWEDWRFFLYFLKKKTFFGSIFDDFKVESAKYFCILRWQNKHLFLKFGPFDIKKTEEIIHFA